MIEMWKCRLVEEEGGDESEQPFWLALKSVVFTVSFCFPITRSPGNMAAYQDRF